MPEAILEPELPIVDPHHHLWDRPAAAPERRRSRAGAPVHSGRRAKSPRYLWDQLNADISSGHNIVATVFVQCGAMYRADGPDALKPVGETEFVNGVAAMSASGIYGPARACAGIVGHADCTLGEAIDETLEAHLKVTDRFKGIRHSCSYDADSGVLGPLARQTPGLYASRRVPQRATRGSPSTAFRSTPGCWSRSCRRSDRPRQPPSRHSGGARPRRHAAGPGELRRAARGALPDLAREHAQSSPSCRT